MIVAHTHTGAKVNVKDTNGQTPLHCASSSGSLECVTFLISQVGVATYALGGVGWLTLFTEGSCCDGKGSQRRNSIT